MKYFLYVNFFEKEMVKSFGAKWDAKVKKWYFEGDSLKEELEQYEETIIDIAYEDKDEYKEKYSIRWDSQNKNWYTSKLVAEQINCAN